MKSRRERMIRAVSVTSVVLFLTAAGPGFSADKEKKPEYDLLAAATAMGNGEIYSGGDPRYQRLAAARAELNQALAFVRSGVGTESLCTPKHCEATSDKGLCHILESLTPDQRSECRNFLTGNAAEMISLNTEEATPFRLSPVPLTVPGPQPRTFRMVSAITRRGFKGPIVFHEGTVDALESAPLLALLTHELGHKVTGKLSLQSGIDDEKPIGHFRRGRDFLDAAGAALALYAPECAAPRQGPPPLPVGVPTVAACDFASDEAARVFLGWAADVEHREATASFIDSMKASLDRLSKQDRIETALDKLAHEVLSGDVARAEAVSELFERFLQRKPTDEEQSLMLSRLRSGGTMDAVAASILGSDDYAAVRGASTTDRFVTLAFLDVVGRSPTRSEMATGMKQLMGFDKPSWALALFASPDAMKHLVTDWFQRYLNRVPTPGETEAYVSRMKAGESWDTACAGILAGAEYRALQDGRFSSCRRTVSSER